MTQMNIEFRERIADVEDFLALCAARDAEHDAPTASLTEIERRLDKTI